MKRYQYLCLLVLLSAPVLSADVSYSGTYSQLNVKLCSDTPPSRSLLPSGSLVCDENPPKADTHCVGSWDYSSTDVFNCGSQSGQEGDLNNNGILDKDEDWDGDGIANGVDPNPTLNDNAELDEDNNGIPDKLDPFFDLYKASRPEFVKCDAQDPDCQSTNTAIYSLANANRDLTRIINHMAEGNTSKQFTRTLENLRQTMTFQEVQTRKELTDLEHAINNIDGGVDNSALIKSEFKDVDEQFSSVENELDDMEEILWDVKSIASDANSSVKSLPTQINAVHQHMDANKGQLIDAINNVSSGSDGLTSQQKTQLKNAAKASANQKLLKELKTTVATNANQLSDQIAAISGGQSTVDLSGVESSISDLSAKIDGLEVGDMSGVEGKIDDLIKGITNNNNFVEPSSSFTGEGFIVTPTDIAEVQNEVIEIKQEMTDEFEKFKALFSIDTSSFNNGTFKEHTLNLNINGSERSFKSGVLSALLDNAAIISAVIMFLFVLSGIRMLGKD